MNSEPIPAWTEADHESGVFDRFLRAVEAAPDHVAVLDESGTALTYRELEAAARSLAGTLLDRLGPGPGQVGLLAPLQVESIIGMMGIIAAGKAYVPVDPAEPVEVARRKLNDADAPLVVTPVSHSRLADTLHGGEGTTVGVSTEGRHGGAPASLPGVRPSDLFNLIYTSGSTGRPKGVVQTHRNVLFDTDASTRMMPVGQADVFGLVVPLTFGASVSNVAGAILNGATLDLFDVKRSGIDAMASWAQDHGITVTHLVPTVFRRWMQTVGASRRYPSMRMIKAGGEPLLRHDLEAFADVFDEGCILRNGLGTTETYLIAAELLTPFDRADGPIVPVGRAALGRSVEIVDMERQRVPLGETGEIAVTSRYLSPGYWHNPEATAAAFASDAHDPDLRTYFTNDLGRIRDDGRLEHLGRMDDMVKVMGQRVELSEVEAALLSVSDVKETAVVATAAGDGTIRLVAYIVPMAGMPTNEGLRNTLAKTLPRHMIPSRFIEMTALPTLRFGKIDRRALPDPDLLDDRDREANTEPRTPLESEIAAASAAILGLEGVGVDSDLFDLGLDSLSATQLVTHLNDKLDLHMTVEWIFDHPTVAAMAAVPTDEKRPEQVLDLASVVSALEDLDDEAVSKLLGGDEQ